MCCVVPSGLKIAGQDDNKGSATEVSVWLA